MKILLVQNMFYIPSYGGANKSNRIMMEGLAKRNHSCLALARSIGAQGPGDRSKFLAELKLRGISTDSPSAGLFEFRCNGVEVHALDELLSLRNHLVKMIQDFEPDWVVVSSEDPGQILLESALQTLPDRVVYFAHTPQAFPFGPASFYPNETGTNLLNQTAGVIAIGQKTASYIHEYTGLNPVILHPPIYGQPPFPFYASFNNPYITLINPSAIKGITIFVELAKSLPEQQFAAVTGWSTPPADVELLKSLPNITTLPSVRDINEIYSKTKILLMPSLYQEGFGLTVVEAMLRGIPVLASDFGGLVDAKLGIDYLIPIQPIEKYRNQYDARSYPIPIIPKQEIAGWVQILRELSGNRNHYQELSDASRRAALKFVSGLGIDSFERFFKDLQPTSFLHSGKEEASGKVGIAARVKNLTPEKRALLALRLKDKSRKDKKTPKVLPLVRLPRKNEDNWFTPSFAQERLWFLDQLGDAGAAYLLSIVLRLRGPLDRKALEQSLQDLGRRHESLRTTFKTIEGDLFQVVSPTPHIPLEFADLTSLPEDQRDFEARRLEREDYRFNLSDGPLIRARLLQLDHDLYDLKFALHHIISDGWSNGILCRELGKLYSSRVSGKNDPLTEPPIQYSDFSVWQRKWLQGNIVELSTLLLEKGAGGIATNTRIANRLSAPCNSDISRKGLSL